MLTLRAGLALLTALLGVHGTATAADLPTLLATPKRHGFSVVQQQPPGGTAYGLFDADRKLLMIAPITHDLGMLDMCCCMKRFTPPRAVPMEECA